MLRMRQHLHQVAGLAIVAQDLRTDHKLYLAIGEFLNELVDGVDRGIVRFTHAKDDFVLGIVLDAMAAEALIHLRINAPERLQNGDRWRESRSGFSAVAQELACRQQAKHIKAHAAKSQDSRNDTGQKMHESVSRQIKSILSQRTATGGHKCGIRAIFLPNLAAGKPSCIPCTTVLRLRFGQGHL